MKHTVTIIAVALVAALATPSAQEPQDAAVVLTPTNHPRVPADLAHLWMAPDRSHVHTAAMNEFSKGVKLEVDADFAKALPVFAQPALQQGPLGLYAQYYKGLAE